MNTTCYKLPIRFDKLLDENGGDLARCTEVESIDQHIELLLTTCPGENRFDRDWGCHIWDMDFERVVSRKKWEEDFNRHIFHAIRKYEKRIKDVTIEVDIQEVAREDPALQTTAIKKRVIVYVNAFLVSNDKKCSFKYILYLGPLSIE